MIGAGLDFSISDTCNTEEIVLKYNIKEAYIDNTLNLYSSLEEFQGIKRLNIFKFYEDTNMLLPIDTEFDIKNGLLYAEVDELGTYCIMDMEIWLNNLGVEMPEVIQQDENVMYFNSPSILSASEDSGSVWTPTYVNLPIDLVFILQSAGTSSSDFDTEKQLIVDFASSIIKDYSNVKITIIEFKKDKANLLTGFLGQKYFTNTLMLSAALNNIEYSYESDYCDRGQAFKILLNDVSLNYGNNIYVYKLVNGRTTSRTIYDNEDVISKVKNNEVRAYSEIMPYGWHYVESSTHTRISNEIAANKDLFITLDSNTLSAMKTHFPTKLSPAKPVYDIIVPTKWKKISLDGELNPDNNIDTDGDTITDWEEVDTERLIWNEDGSFEIPTFEVAVLVDHLNRFQSPDYNFLFNELKNKLPRHYLPILSDPTIRDSDGDGVEDWDEDISKRLKFNEFAFVFYDNEEFSEQGIDEGKYLKSKNSKLEVRTLPIDNKTEFIEYWELYSGINADISFVFHGSPIHLWIVNDNLMDDEVETLKTANIKTLRILACNCGHKDVKDNIASLFKKYHNIDHLYAMDGNISYYPPVVGGWGWGEYNPRLSTTQKGFYEYASYDWVFVGPIGGYMKQLRKPEGLYEIK